MRVPPTLTALVAAALLVAPTGLAVAAEHGDTGELEHKVDTAKLSGFNKWLGNLYNTDRWTFALVVTVTMAVMGAVIAVAADFILKRLGLEAKRMEHRE